MHTKACHIWYLSIKRDSQWIKSKIHSVSYSIAAIQSISNQNAHIYCMKEKSHVVETIASK